MRIDAEAVTTITLSQATLALEALLETERETGERVTPVILGPPGQGKTAIVQQLVNKLNRQRTEKISTFLEEGKSLEEAEIMAGAEWALHSFRLAQSEPSDLKGCPVYVSIDGVEMSAFAAPQIFPIVDVPNSARGKNVVLFLDELPQAPPTLQNLGANIIDGVVGDAIIDKNRSFIVCAGNRRQDRSATYEIPLNVVTRLVHMEVRTTFNEWRDGWALSNNISPLILGYLSAHQVEFNEPPPENTHVYATPRSWHKLSCQVQTLGPKFFAEEGIGWFLAQGTVGIATATNFINFCRSMRDKYSVDDIFQGKPVPKPSTEERDVIFSIIFESVGRINSWLEEVVNNPVYPKDSSDSTKKIEVLIKLLGPEKITSIINIYQWLDDTRIDPAYQVLINKYQSPLTRDNLRIALLLAPEFAACAASYERIHKALLQRS